MRIGELATQAGVAPHTIRYYERQGLLRAPARTAGGFRVYNNAALDDLRFIQKAQSLGLSLAQIREVMEIASGGRVPCTHVRKVLRARLADVEDHLKQLRALQATLRQALRRLERTPAPRSGCRCAVIESIRDP